jgi:hypothetical protein
MKDNISKNQNCEFCGFPLNETAVMNQDIKKRDEIDNLKESISAMKELLMFLVKKQDLQDFQDAMVKLKGAEPWNAEISGQVIKGVVYERNLRGVGRRARRMRG